MNKDFYVKAILSHTHSFRLSGDCKTIICNWCNTRTYNTTQEEASHLPECPYLKASKEKTSE